MHCSLLKRIILASLFFIIIVLKWDNVQATTRWQPSIIWDRFNPLLKCKCNWMNNIPQLDIYDRVELLCPKPYIVSAYRTHDISKASVYYNMHMRVFNATTHSEEELKELQKSLDNGSFCDPSQSTSLYKCKQGDATKNYKIRIHSDEKFEEGNLAVIFSNTLEGKQSEVDSDRKKCTMVFIVNVTSSDKKAYDMSYGKCLKPKPENCGNIEEDCNCGNDPAPTATPKPGTTPSSAKTTDKTVVSSEAIHSSSRTTTKTVQVSSETRPSTSSTTDKTKPTKSTGSPHAGGRSGKTSDTNSPWLGLFVAATVIVLIQLVIIVWICSKKNGKMMLNNKPPQNEITPPCKSATAGFPNEAFPSTSPTPTAPPYDASNEKMMLNNKPQNEITPPCKSATAGFPNQGFAATPTTPAAPPHDPSNGFVAIRVSTGRLPSVGETNERSRRLPPIKMIPRTKTAT